MEIHASYFINHFTNHQRFFLSGVITKDFKNQDCILSGKHKQPINIKELSLRFSPAIVFFNSGRWVEELSLIRHLFPYAVFFYRTGGNEILKASLDKQFIPDHVLRQSFWANSINNAIDILITNSEHTEKRLRKIGINCCFLRCIGGVDSLALISRKSTSCNMLTFFCGARFVPYKNHLILISIINELVLRGLIFKVRLAGDGPLLNLTKKKVLQSNLLDVVEFLGALDNRQNCHEIAAADIYIQLSTNLMTTVPGGSYMHCEGMGRSILEAITAGTFVVAGQSGALSEIVSQERGLLVDLNDIEGTINEIENIIRYPPARCFPVQDFCWIKLFKKYERAFEEAYEDISRYRKV